MKIKTSNLLELMMILASTTVSPGSDKPKGKEEIISIEQAPTYLKSILIMSLNLLRGNQRFLLEAKSSSGKTFYFIAGQNGCCAIDNRGQDLNINDLLKYFSMSKIKDLFEKSKVPNGFENFINQKLQPMTQNLLTISPDRFDSSIFSREVLDIAEPVVLFKEAGPKLIQMAKDAQNAYKNLQKRLDYNQTERELKHNFNMDSPECVDKHLRISSSFEELKDTMSEIFKKQKSFEVDHSMLQRNPSEVTKWLVKNTDSEVQLIPTYSVLKEIMHDKGLDKTNQELIQMAQKSTNTYSNLLILSQLSELTQEQKEYFEQLAEKCKIEV